ncbi:hypothetical protein ELI48_08515 [Rhizobium ruizarguesonis]|uniref:hypothetical protein n=1 Tax=Rhizobium ruizarguesonis TaxID=2081791 RepID=UPI0010323DAD|nr:hypothetical protein [Rhizobium ruizarguesonis]TAU26215.1 hypothetical protein ELI48_08515 [Rhizobium ruizarguesonis]
MADELKTIKFQMMLSESEAKMIDDWGFANRIRSRAEAIRRLCQIALYVEQRVPGLLVAANTVVGDALKGLAGNVDDETGLDPQLAGELLRLNDLIHQAQVISRIIQSLQKGETLEEAKKHADEVVSELKIYLDRAKAWKND